jgi:hypothetical protein
MTIKTKANTQSLAPGAGWSSPVARQAHNLKVVGSNPTPATKYNEQAAVEKLAESLL